MTGAIAAAIIGYGLGSVPWGLVLSRLGGYGDIRHIGSGNTGATNVLRTGSKTLAGLTLAFDIFKGTAAVLIGGIWGQDAALVAGGAVLIGHMFPVWLGFRGGKGVATAFGVFITIAWPVALGGAAVWLVVALAFQYSSLAAATFKQYKRMIKEGLGELDKSGIAELTFKGRHKSRRK